METIITAPVNFSEGAIKQIYKLMSEPGFNTDQLLRVGVKGGGCSGLSYVLEFDHIQENDTEFFVNDIHCIMNKAHEIYLFGMEIDWQNGLSNRGFTFQNPNASKTCGCGTSFSV